MEITRFYKISKDILTRQKMIKNHKNVKKKSIKWYKK